MSAQEHLVQQGQTVQQGQPVQQGHEAQQTREEGHTTLNLGRTLRTLEGTQQNSPHHARQSGLLSKLTKNPSHSRGPSSSEARQPKSTPRLSPCYIETTSSLR